MTPRAHLLKTHPISLYFQVVWCGCEAGVPDDRLASGFLACGCALLAAWKYVVEMHVVSMLMVNLGTQRSKLPGPGSWLLWIFILNEPPCTGHFAGCGVRGNSGETFPQKLMPSLGATRKRCENAWPGALAIIADSTCTEEGTILGRPQCLWGLAQ